MNMPNPILCHFVIFKDIYEHFRKQNKLTDLASCRVKFDTDIQVLYFGKSRQVTWYLHNKPQWVCKHSFSYLPAQASTRLQELHESWRTRVRVPTDSSHKLKGWQNSVFSYICTQICSQIMINSQTIIMTRLQVFCDVTQCRTSVPLLY